MSRIPAVSVDRLAAASGVLVPRAAEACASCVSWTSGDQPYTWAYVGLMAAPFAVVLGIGAVLTGCHLSARRRRAARTVATLNEETA